MFGAVAALRAAGVTTVLVSNSFGMHAYDGYELDAQFDHMVVSAEVGARKPSGAIYRRAIELAGCAPEDGLFVDDLQQNVDGARRAGMRGVLHTNVPTRWTRWPESFGRPLRSAPSRPRKGDSDAGGAAAGATWPDPRPDDQPPPGPKRAEPRRLHGPRRGT